MGGEVLNASTANVFTVVCWGQTLLLGTSHSSGQQQISLVLNSGVVLGVQMLCYFRGGLNLPTTSGYLIPV